MLSCTLRASYGHFPKLLRQINQQILVNKIIIYRLTDNVKYIAVALNIWEFTKIVAPCLHE